MYRWLAQQLIGGSNFSWHQTSEITSSGTTVATFLYWPAITGIAVLKVMVTLLAAIAINECNLLLHNFGCMELLNFRFAE
jgi:hypothetical protein